MPILSLYSVSSIPVSLCLTWYVLYGYVVGIEEYYCVWVLRIPMVHIGGMGVPGILSYLFPLPYRVIYGT